MTTLQTAYARIPKPIRDFVAGHAEFIKFAIVGATTFVIDSGVFYTLKLTIMDTAPGRAKVIAGVIAVLASYSLNRRWSFKHRGGRARSTEAFWFFLISGIGVILSTAPLYVSRYVFDLQVPNVSLTVENITDFVSAYIIGNLLQMVFRYFTFKWFVFPEKREPAVVRHEFTDAALHDAAFTASLAEDVTDAEQGRHGEPQPQ